MTSNTAVSKNRLIAAVIILLTSILAIVMSLMLLRTTTFAVVVYTLSLGLSILFIDPYLGLINYIFFLYVRLQEFVPGFEGLPVMLILSAATIALILVHMTIRRTTLGLKMMPQHWLTLWFYAAIILSNVFHGNLFMTNICLQGYTPLLFLYFMIIALLETEKKAVFFFYHLLVMTMFLAFAGIFQYYTGRGLAGQELVADRVAWIGIFNDPNDLASALLMMMPFAILLMLDSKQGFLKPLYLACVIALATCVLFTESRGGILAMGFLMPVIVARRYGYKYAAIIAIVVLAGIFAFGPERMSTVSTEEASARERIESWTVGINLFQMNPLFGIGTEQYTMYHYITAHNSIVLAAAETGMFGLYPWVFLFYISFKNLHYVQRESRKRGWANLALISESLLLGLVAWLAAGVFISRTYSPLLFMLFGMAASLTGIFVDKSGERYAIVEKMDFVGAFVAMVGGILALKVFLIWAW